MYTDMHTDKRLWHRFDVELVQKYIKSYWLLKLIKIIESRKGLTELKAQQELILIPTGKMDMAISNRCLYFSLIDEMILIVKII